MTPHAFWTLYLSISLFATATTIAGLVVEYIYSRSQAYYTSIKRVDFLALLFMSWIPGVDFIIIAVTLAAITEMAKPVWCVVPDWFNEPIFKREPKSVD